MNRTIEADRMDRIVGILSNDETRGLFDDMNLNADTHPPLTRQLYLALYRRLHG